MFKKFKRKIKIKITFNLLSKISFLSWAVFVLLFIYLGSSESQSIKALSGFILPVILLGTLSFILGFVCLSLSRGKIKKIQKKESKEHIKIIENESPNKFLAILLALIILFSAFLYVKAENNEKNLKDKNFKSNLKPTPNKLLQPTSTLKPKTQVTTDTNNTGSQVDCIGPDGKQFRTSMDECKKLNEKWGKPVNYMTNCNIHVSCGGGIVRMSKSQCDQPCSGLPNNTQKTNNQSGSGSGISLKPLVACRVSYPCTGNSYTYQMYEDTCFEAQQSALSICNSPNPVIPTQQTVTSITSISQSDIDRCKAEVRREIQSLTQGCYIKFQGSAAEGCVSIYQSRGSSQLANCEKYSTHTPIVDNIQPPTPKCYATWEEYFNAHPNYAPQNIQYISGSPPCD